MITRNTFADFWRSIFSKSKEVLSHWETSQTEFLLFEFEEETISEAHLTIMSEIMNRDSLFIQKIRKATGMAPDLRITKDSGCVRISLLLTRTTEI